MLVRSAHSANIKERRDASTALFDAEGAMVMQAEHIPVHLGRDAVGGGRGAGRGPRARATRGSSTTPTAAAPTCPTSRVIAPALPRGRAGRLRRQPRPPRRRGRARARQHAGGLAHAGGRGRGDPAHPARPTTCCASWPARMRNPRQREADLRAQLAAGRAGAERRRRRSLERYGLETLRAGLRETLDYAERRTRARIAELEDGSREARDVLEAADGDLELRLRATVAGDEIELDFTGTAAQHDGNLNCPLAVTAVRLLLRAARAHRPRRAALRGRLPPAHGDRARGLAPQRPPARRRGRRQRGDLLAGGRPRARPRSGARCGQGTMNNLTLGNDDFTYYETARRRPGRVPGRRRPERRARGHVQHAQHPDRGARAGVPAAGRGVLAAARLRRRRPHARRRRRGARARGAGRHALLADHRAPPPPRRPGPRAAIRARRVGTSLNGEELPAEGLGRARARRPAANRDPRRWWTWRALRTTARRGAWRSSAWGSWARRWRPTWPRAGFELCRLDPHGREGGALRGRARRGGGRHPGRGRRGRRRRDHDGGRRARGRGRAARRPAAPPRRCGRARSAIDMSTIAPTAALAIGERLARAGHRVRRRAGDRLAPEGRGRHAHDHGRRRGRTPSRAPEPLFEAMGELVVHVGPRGPRGDDQGDHQHGRRDQRGRARRGARAWRSAPGWTPTRSSRWPARARAPRRCSS